MRLLRLILILAIILVMALCVQENAHNLSSMTVFGLPFFTDVATPIIVFIAVLTGVLLGYPLAVCSRNARARRKKACEEEAARARKKKQAHAPEAVRSEHTVNGYPLNGGN